MTINSPQLLDAYEQARVFARDDAGLTALFAPVERVFEEKKAKADAVVMVYGVYNAGKSTVINMLLGREEAAADDIPLTDKVSPYQWGSYVILDTPGVDAPIAHEQVTREQMLTADAVIFVVDPVGTAEESKTLHVLVDLLQQRKQVFLVFNEKKPISDEDYIKLKDQTRGRLQQMAAERGLENVLGDIPIVKINAKRALQGMLKAQPKFVELSGYPAFEKQLTAFLQGITAENVYARLQQQLLDVLQQHATTLEGRAQSRAGEQYDRLLRKISSEKAELAQGMQRELVRQRQNIYDKSKLYMRNAPEDCQARIAELMQKSAEQVCASMQNQMTTFMNLVQDQIDTVQAAALPAIDHALPDVQVPPPGQRPADAGDGAPPPDQTIDGNMLKDAALQFGTFTKPEHIVGGLKMVKSALPSMMKGIGIKTMEKWASTFVTKWIPYVGVAVSVGQVLYGLFAGDPEEARLRKQTEAEQRERERAIQQMEDFALEIADGFERSMSDIIAQQTESFFANIAQQVELLRQSFSQAEQSNSARLAHLLDILQQAKDA
ncbi:hypothetical protein GJ697_05210 [Pseudoduganella sp. FT25W]|jgi:GTPase SAR1 family protein|uniref:G domain-containing protein n=1 Tax=Duganella alba TaxID=2666081 RepID=A0A6L5QCB6_9BURK|nr:GTPase [Duganella alba]MRX07230.1 hypothetical protein [Duganella alba]MRX15075.1 hypothetical protein [Duganella alba]